MGYREDSLFYIIQYNDDEHTYTYIYVCDEKNVNKYISNLD